MAFFVVRKRGEEMDKQHEWIRINEARERYRVNYRTLRKLATACNAWKKVSNIVFVDALALDRYIAES